MNVTFLIVVVSVIAVGCAEKKQTEPPASRPTALDTAPVVNEPPPVEHIIVSTADSPLKPVEIRYGDPMGRRDMQTTITAEGFIRHVSTDNKVYGAGSKAGEKVEIRQGHLTPEQMKDLARMFAGWEALSDKVFIPVPDAPGVTIRYGDSRPLPVGHGMPKQVDDVNRKIGELAASMPQVAAEVLKPVDLSYMSPMEHLEFHTTITAEGVLHSVRTDSRSGTKPRDRVETREGRLTPEQMTDLAGMFAGWETFTTKGLIITNDGAGIAIRYGSSKALPVALGMPKQVYDAYRTIRELTALMPKVGR